MHTTDSGSAATVPGADHPGAGPVGPTAATVE